jgi:hypothetical protein
VDKTVDVYDKDYQPWSEQDKTNWEQCESTLIEWGSNWLTIIFAKTILKFSKARQWACN